MSNIEPTEEQKQAARNFYGLKQHLPLSRELARLLAEREAKAVARIKALANDEIAACGAHIDSLESLLAKATDERGILLARVAELESEVRIAWADCHDGSCEACAKCVDQAKHQRDFATARVAELERLDLDRDRALYLAEVEYFAASAREAQHLADIKALMAPADDILNSDGDVDRFEWGINEYRETVKRLAHYDDAKAAEGGEG